MKLFLTRLAAFAIISLMALSAAVMVQAGTTGIISGIAKDAETGTVLSGANIIVSGTKLSTVTDAAGRFIILNVPPGMYEVSAELVGYAVGILGNVQVTMDSTAVADFDLGKEAIEEQAAVITRSRPMIDATMATTMTSVTVQQENMARLDPGSVRSAPGILSALPGVLVEPNGSGQMHVRGGRMDQTGWYLEGIPITDPNMGAFGTNLFTTGMSNFQVYTGGFGAEYGNAIAGVLNEIKKTGADTPGFTLNTEGGNGFSRDMFAEVGGGDASSFNYYVGTALHQNDMETTVLDKQEYADSIVKLVWPSEKNKLTFIGMQGSLYGRLISNQAGYNRQRYTVSSLTWSHDFNENSFMTVQPYYLSTIVAYNTNGLDDAYIDIWSAQKGLKVNYDNQLNKKHLLKAGGTIALSNNNCLYNFPLYATAYGMPFYTYQADVDTTQSDFYAEDRIKLSDKVTAQAGLRFDSMKYDRTGRAYVAGVGYTGAPVPDVTESTISPRLGLTYAANERSVWKTNWGKYTKFAGASTLQKIYADPVASEPIFPGIGATAPQRSNAWEISYEKQLTDSMSCRITSFRTEYDNLIDSFTDPNTFATVSTNLGEGESTGAELYVRKKMSDKWQGWLSYTYQKVRANRADLGLADGLYYTTWDQLHTMTMVGYYKNGRCGHSLRVDMGSGRADTYTTLASLAAGNRANPYAVISYNMSLDLPVNSSIGNAIYLNIYNILNSGQTTQSDSTGTRSSWMPSRSVNLGITKGF